MPTPTTSNNLSRSTIGDENDNAVIALTELAQLIDARIVGDAAGVVARGVNALDAALADELTFVSSRRHAQRWSDSKACAVVASDSVRVDALEPGATEATVTRPILFVPDAELAMITVLEHFAPPIPQPEPGVHPTAWVHPDATIANDARIGPHVSIDRGAVIGAGCSLHAGVRVYAGVTIGAQCTLHSNVVIRERCRIGDRVIIHPNATIGADGFGYRPDPSIGGLRKVPQIGIVDIGNDVEIGAGSCIDRAKFGRTVIGDGVKIDDLVMVGHNCHVEPHVVLVAQTGLGGSVHVGQGAMLGGQVGVADHLRIGRGARVAGKTGVMLDVPDGQSVQGIPALPQRQALRQFAALHKLSLRPGASEEPGTRPSS